VLSAKPGMHRWVWDLHLPPPAGSSGRGGGFFGSAGAWALPGQYTVRLIVDGTTYSQPLTVQMDPRLHVSAAELQQQFDISREAGESLSQVSQAAGQAQALRTRISRILAQPSMSSTAGEALKGLASKVDEVAGVVPAANPDDAGVALPSNDRSSLRYLQGVLQRILQSVNNGEAAPTQGALDGLRAAQQTLATTLSKWDQIKNTSLPQVNAVLKENSLPSLLLDAGRELRNAE